MSLHELEAEALKLEAADQVRLLHALAVALDEKESTELTNEELDKRWADFEIDGKKGVDSAELRERALKRFGSA
jgi:hypothetical protein